MASLGSEDWPKASSHQSRCLQSHSSASLIIRNDLLKGQKIKVFHASEEAPG